MVSSSILLLVFWFILNVTTLHSIDLNVFIYDSTQETTDKSSDILTNCNCTSNDMVTSFRDGWDYIYNQGQQILETPTNINFYFLSNLIITNNDINNYISNIPSSIINFQCAKTLQNFKSISWHMDDTECVFTFHNESIQNNTDSLLLSYIDNTTISTITDISITINDLIINFDSNSNNFIINASYNETSEGILFQTISSNYDNITHIDLSFNNIIIEGGFNIHSPLFTITHHVALLSVTNCEFYDMTHGIFIAEDTPTIIIDSIKIINVSDYYEEPITIVGAINITMNNIDSDECSGNFGCISVRQNNHSYITNFRCNKCSGRTGGFYGHTINDMIASNIYISNNIATDLAAGFRVRNGLNRIEITNGIFIDNSGDGSGVLTLYGVNNFYINNLTFINNKIQPLSLQSNVYGEVHNCNFTNNIDTGSGGALFMNNGGNGDEYWINNCFFKGNKAEKFAGAIFNQYCSVYITDSQFIQNEADIGGAIAYLDWASPNPMYIRNSIFINNIAYSSGGGLYVFSGEYVLDTIECIDNQAKISGGCLHDANGFLDCNDANPVRTRILSSKFYGNKARQAAVGYLTACFFSMDNSEIINNTAYIQGGGFVIDSTTISTNIDANIGNNQYQLNSNIFSGNYGGLSGGAMILTGGDILISGNTQFNKNSAGSKGGAILIQGIDEWNVNTNIQNTQFNGNNAENGGAIHMETIQLSSTTDDEHDESDIKAANLILTECDLYANEGISGGGLYIANGNILTNDCLLSGNTAVNGGALYFKDGDMSDWNSIFDDNYAKSKGGAVFIDNYNILFDETVLTKNDAQLYGGGIYFNHAKINTETEQCILTTDMSKNVTINNNTAMLSGGGYFFQVNDILRSTFENSDCSMTSNACKWCNHCDIISNLASGFGNDFGTKAYKMNVSWHLNKGDILNRITSVRIDVDIRDFVCDLVSRFDESDVTLTANVTTNHAEQYPLLLEGASLETFTNGKASLLFKVIPQNDNVPFIKNDVIFDAVLTVSSSLQQDDNNDNNSTALFTESINIRYENKLYTLPAYVIVLGVLLGIICLITVIITVYLTKYYGTEKIITGSNVYFLFIILIGIGFASISMIFVPLVPFDVDCRVLLWFVHFAFVLTVCPLAGKTWRIWLFFYWYQGTDNKKEFKWTTIRLANVFVLLPLGVLIIYLLIWSFAMNWDLQYSYNSDAEIYVIKSCPFHSGFYTFSYVVVSISILILVRLAIGTRKVPKNFNESFWLGACIYTICILIIFMIPISLVNTITTSTRRTFSIIASFVVIESMLLFLFWTKFFRIKGWFKSTKFAFMRNNGATGSRTSREPSNTNRSKGSGNNNNNNNNNIGTTKPTKTGEPSMGNHSPKSNVSSAKNKILTNMKKKRSERDVNKLSANYSGEQEKIASTTNTQLGD